MVEGANNVGLTGGGDFRDCLLQSCERVGCRAGLVGDGANDAEPEVAEGHVSRHGIATSVDLRGEVSERPRCQSEAAVNLQRRRVCEKNAF